MSILEVRDVSIIYSDDKRVAVEHASFKIEAGEYACIIGSNGSGKSTLVKGIVGLVPVTSGEVIHVTGAVRLFITDYGGRKRFSGNRQRSCFDGHAAFRKTFSFLYTRRQEESCRCHGDIGYYRSGRLQDRQPFRRSEAACASGKSSLQRTEAFDPG